MKKHVFHIPLRMKNSADEMNVSLCGQVVWNRGYADEVKMELLRLDRADEADCKVCRNKAYRFVELRLDQNIVRVKKFSAVLSNLSKEW